MGHRDGCGRPSERYRLEFWAFWRPEEGQQEVLSAPGVLVALMWTGSVDRPPGNGSVAREDAKCDRMLSWDGVPC